jgi:hypothetical protein
MAQDVRPFRTGATALFMIAAVIFALGFWAQIAPQATNPAMQLITDVAAPTLIDSIPAMLGRPETTFGLFAKFGGLVALAGLLLLTLRRRGADTPAAPVAPPMPRVTPRRPSDLRALRTARPAP